MCRLGLSFGIVALGLTLAGAAPVQAGRTTVPSHPPNDVDVLLVLAVDVSLSMDDEEQRIQRDGYVQGFRDNLVQQAIKSGPSGRIAVTYVEWSGEDEQKVVVDWTLIDSPQAANTFADTLAAQPIGRVRRTSISSAMLFSARLMESAAFTARRRVIDFSGDGSNNDGPSIVQAHAQVIDKGIVINGLPLTLDRMAAYYANEPVTLQMYYEACVIGGPGSFLIPVKTMGEFRDALKTKLILEIAGVQPRATPMVIPAADTDVKPAVACDGRYSF